MHGSIRAKTALLLLATALSAPGMAFAQSSPNFMAGQVLTAAQLNAALGTKLDVTRLGAGSGVAPLDSGGNVPAANLGHAASLAPVQSVMGHTGNVTLLESDIIAALGFTPVNTSNIGAANGVAPLDSASQVPTANLGHAAALAPVQSVAGRTGVVVVGTGDIAGFSSAAAAAAPVQSVAGRTGVVVVGTGDIAGFSSAAAAAAPVQSVAGRTGVVVVGTGDIAGFSSAAAAAAPVQSVAGRTGAVVVGTADVAGLGTMATQSAAAVAITGGVVSGDVSQSTITASGSGAVAATAQTQHYNDAVYVNDFISPAPVLNSNFFAYNDCTETAGTLASGSNTLTLSACSIPAAAAGHASIYIQGAGTLSTVGAATAVSVTGAGEYTVVPHAQLAATTGAYGSGIGADTPLLLTGEVVNIADWTIVNPGVCPTASGVVFTFPAGATGNVAATFTAEVSGGGISTLDAIGNAGAYVGVQPGPLLGGPLPVTGGGCTTPPQITPRYGVASIGFQTVGQTGHTISYYSNGWPVSGTTVAFSSNGTQTTAATATVTITPFRTGLKTPITGISGSTITLSAAAAATVSNPFVIAYGTDISAPIANAVAAGRSSTSGAPGIRKVVISPLKGGGAYFVGSGTVMPNSQSLEGEDCVGNSAGNSPTAATLTIGATWLAYVDDQAPAIKLQGHGASTRCLNIWHPQPAPVSGWTPIRWPKTWDMGGNFQTIEDETDENGSDGYVITGGGTKDRIVHVMLGDSVAGASYINSNDTIYLEDVHVRYLWNDTNPYVTSYVNNNLVGAFVGRADNMGVHSFEDVFGSLGVYFYNVSSGGQIESEYNSTWQDFQCALVEQCAQVNDPGTIVVWNLLGGTIQGPVATQGTYTNPFFSFASNFVLLNLSSVQTEPLLASMFSLGSGDTTPGTAVPKIGMAGGFIGSTMSGLALTWGAQTASPLATVSAPGVLEMSGITPLRAGLSAAKPLISGSGTLVYNGSTSPNAQWLDVVSAGAVSNCGTGSSATGHLRDITLTVGTGTPTGCTIALSGTVSATPTFAIQQHQAGNTGWNASVDAGHIVIGSPGLPAGTYDLIAAQ